MEKRKRSRDRKEGKGKEERANKQYNRYYLLKLNVN